MEGGRTHEKPREQRDEEASTSPAMEAARTLSWKMRISFSRTTKLCVMLKAANASRAPLGKLSHKLVANSELEQETSCSR